ncbi:class I SAM-dependent methyltransferase [Chelativorans sp. M5D2P16]|uniref:class I SAM-dependent methyltransferase n=1 Tax=Chelativorans sp. M5D2P16 TaxID=3095678 RepID=UPI002ACAC88B|nr:class I SAM-dependent methyltransferase [Chelativorans sp. M5D2P16]MDZ5699895.1 class I SAM-dependent methyltransferase [Chelativorans sp. M5D2P16]
MSGRANYSLRDEIRDYWSARAETFDFSVGHEIFSEEERAAWHRLILKHLGPGERRRALDLACGTGVVSHLMHDLGYTVTGLDWSEAMLARARAKTADRKSDIRFLLGDAERTLEEPESYDVIVTRHLVWTLVDPQAAFTEWFSLLKPGGRLLIVDGDFVTETWVSRMRRVIEKLRPEKEEPSALGAEMRARHQSILSRVYFSRGARAEQISRLVLEAGFLEPVIDKRLGAIHRAQARHMGFLKALERAVQYRYAICASKRAEASKTSRERRLSAAATG